MEEEEEVELEYDSDDAQSQYTATSGIDDYEQVVFYFFIKFLIFFN